MADLDKVDWDAAYARQWNDTSDDMDRQRRKQAEFLVHRFCPWRLVESIGVRHDAGRQRVEDVLAAHGVGNSVPVYARAEWYY